MRIRPTLLLTGLVVLSSIFCGLPAASAMQPGPAVPAPPAAISAPAPAFAATIPGGRPSAMILDPARNRFWIDTGSLLLVMTLDGVILRQHVGTSSVGTLGLVHGIVYNFGQNGDRIRRFDPASLDELAPIALPGPTAGPIFVAGGSLWLIAGAPISGTELRRIAPDGTAEVFPIELTPSAVQGDHVLSVPTGQMWSMATNPPTLVRQFTGLQPMMRSAIGPGARTVFTNDRATLVEWSVDTGRPTGRSIDGYWNGGLFDLASASPSGDSIFVMWGTAIERVRVADLTALWHEGISALPGTPVVVDASGEHLHLATMGNELLTLPTPPPPMPPPGPGAFHPVTPARVLDTRDGLGAPRAKVGPNEQIRVQVTGTGGVPTARVSAVVLNVTATAPSEPGYLTVWPSDRARPTASSLNFRAGQTVPNLVTTAVSPDGYISIANAYGQVDLVADVVGWYDQGGDRTGTRFVSHQPTRILDTREGSWIAARDGVLGVGGLEPLHEGQRLSVMASELSQANAAIVNITVVNPSTAGFLTVYPSGQARPTASSLNFVAGDVRSNLVIVGLGPTTPALNGFDIFNAYGDADIVVDLLGWFDKGYGADFTAINPTRVLDTRTGGGLDDRSTGTLTFPPDLYGSGVAGYALNITVTNTTQPSFLTVWPADVEPAFTSMLNWQAGDTVPNQVIMRIPGDGRLAFYNHNGHADVIIDVVGIYWD